MHKKRSKMQMSRCSIYQWAQELLGEGSVSSVPKQNKAEEPKPATIEELQSQVNDLTMQARELKDVQMVSGEKPLKSSTQRSSQPQLGMRLSEEYKAM